MRRTIVLLSFIYLCSLPLQAQTQESMSSIRADSIQIWITYFSSDNMKGRDTPSPELDSCAMYISRHFSRWGLQPVVGDSSYFQAVHLSHTRISEPNRFTINQAGEIRAYELKNDFIPLHMTANKSVTAPVVFAGYGITAPEYDYDDYAGTDVKGKIVFMFTHEPQENDSTSVFEGTRMTEHGTLLTKVLNAQVHGAAGVIVVTDPLNHRFRRPPNDWPSLMKNALVNAIPLTLDEKEENQIVTVRVGRDLADDLIAPSGLTLEQVQEKLDADRTGESFPISDIEVTIQTTLKADKDISWNVLGLIEGTSPEKKDEYILIGAHYDHLGVLNDSTIFNGADDNASGTAGMMSLARAFSAHPPQRSVLFCAWAGEEKGLFGSRFYSGSDPVLPLERTVALINLDMISRSDSSGVFCSGISSAAVFPELVKKAAAEEGIHIIEKKSVSRSDHAPFYQKNIPVLGFDTGEHKDYHQPTDTVDKCNFRGMEEICRLVYRLVWRIAESDKAPIFLESGK